jgi:cytidylate kinase
VSSQIVVAVDGPSGSGKSSTARGVARRLGLAYLDTGAMYRAITWALLERGVDLDDAAAVAAAAADVVLRSGTDPVNPTIEADGVDVSEPIRGADVTSNVSVVAAVPDVRALLVQAQRDAIRDSLDGIVVEGRDIGTAVAPDAPVKVYLVADADARARRRASEQGHDDADATQEALARRDHLDSSRAASPLTKADDAVLIDGTFLTLDEVIDAVVALVEEARGR